MELTLNKYKHSFDRVALIALSCLIISFIMSACKNDDLDLVAESKLIKTTIDSSFVFDAKIQDTCTFKPSIKLHSFKDDGLLYDERLFYDSLNPDRILTSYLLFKTSGSCNDEGVEIGNHKWVKDTLTIYTYWCYGGYDPTGHEWGGAYQNF